MTLRHRILLAALAALAAAPACADKVPLTDGELRDVAGQGVAIAVHLELNSGLLSGRNIDSRLAAGFDVDGVTTYAIAQNFGGVLDLFAVTLNPSTRAGGGDYLAIGLPYYLGAQEFGVRAFGIQGDVNAPITNSLGSLLLNGTATMTGQLNVWPK